MELGYDEPPLTMLETTNPQKKEKSPAFPAPSNPFPSMDLPFPLKDRPKRIAPRPFELPHLAKRLWQLLFAPRAAFHQLDDETALLVSVLLVSGTPLIASLAKLSQKTDSFNAWLGALSMGFLIQSVMWFAIAGLLYLSLPFLGIALPFKKHLILSGLGWAPRLLGAFLSALYPLIRFSGLIIGENEFSAGIDLIPGVPAAPWISFLGRVGLFDVWAAGITLAGVSSINNTKEQWNLITLLIGFACLFLGAFTSY